MSLAAPFAVESSLSGIYGATRALIIAMIHLFYTFTFNLPPFNCQTTFFFFFNGRENSTVVSLPWG